MDWTTEDHVRRWIDAHPNVRTITTDRIARSLGWDHVATRAHIEKALESLGCKRMYCWQSNVLLNDELSESPVPPFQEWVRGRFDERIHVDDCDWVPVYVRPKVMANSEEA